MTIENEAVVNDDATDFDSIDLNEEAGEIDDDVADFDSVDLSEDKEEPAKEDIKEEGKEEKLDLKTEDDKAEIKDEESEVVSFKAGDKNFDIPKNATITKKVDGEDVEVNIQDALNAYAGKGFYDKEIGKLSTEKKEFNTEKHLYSGDKDVFMGKVNNWVDAVNTGNAAGALESLAKIADVNPIQLRESFLGLMRGQVEAYVKMSPEEQKTFDNDQKIKYYEQQQEMNNQELVNQSEQAESQKEVFQFQQKYGIDDHSLVALADELTANQQDLSIEALESLHQDKVTQDKASTILGSIEPSLQENSEHIKQVADFIQANPDLSDEDVKDCITEAIAELNGKAKSEDNSNTSKQLKSKTAKNSKLKQKGNNEFVGDELDDVVDFDEVPL